jgi:hypothetical protein
MREADVAVTQGVRPEDRNACITTCAADRHPKSIARHAGKQRRARVSILGRKQPCAKTSNRSAGSCTQRARRVFETAARTGHARRFESEGLRHNRREQASAASAGFIEGGRKASAAIERRMRSSSLECSRVLQRYGREAIRTPRSRSRSFQALLPKADGRAQDCLTAALRTLSNLRPHRRLSSSGERRRRIVPTRLAATRRL